jgi:hypothetical protein
MAAGVSGCQILSVTAGRAYIGWCRGSAFQFRLLGTHDLFSKGSA